MLRRSRELGGNNGPLSNRALEDRAGGLVSRTVFQRIMAGEYDAKVGQRTIDGLVKALDVDERTVAKAAGAPPSYGPFKLTEDAARLTPSQRKAVKHVVEVLLEANEPVEQRPPLRLASRRGKPDQE